MIIVIIITINLVRLGRILNDPSFTQRAEGIFRQGEHFAIK